MSWVSIRALPKIPNVSWSVRWAALENKLEKTAFLETARKWRNFVFLSIRLCIRCRILHRSGFNTFVKHPKVGHTLTPPAGYLAPGREATRWQSLPCVPAAEQVHKGIFAVVLGYLCKSWSLQAKSYCPLRERGTRKRLECPRTIEPPLEHQQVLQMTARPHGSIKTLNFCWLWDILGIPLSRSYTSH